MSDTKKAAPAAAKEAPTPAGKGASKPAAGAKAQDAPVKKVTKSAAKRLAKKLKEAAKLKKKPRRGGVGKRNRKARGERKEQKIAAKREKRAAETKDGPPAKRQRAPHREIASGVMKFSRPYKYHRRGVWKCALKKPKKVTPKKPKMIKKVIGGEKNGGFRMVLLKKRPNNYPTADRIKKRKTRGVFKKHHRYTRKSLKPGTICILLAGIHRGKRVVLLKVLKSGLLLVNGPFSLNGCPLRRVSQNYVIATRTRLNLGEAIPGRLNDDYFKRDRPKKSKKEEGDIFTTKKEKYVPTEQRKKDQIEMDKLVLDAITKFGKRKKLISVLKKYMKSMFGLRRHQKPHNTIF